LIKYDRGLNLTLMLLYVKGISIMENLKN
jgi:hypothetical protein